ncbi:unnamed protein product [Moneuplotes crassus]|uniref:Uncharacterized protein n=1 Tax=Euplotes crassus TaxID=5936 RepID=A0AAD1XS79_EUPCR|nr:unnamed protein product [Moneuplotes crassus]
MVYWTSLTGSDVHKNSVDQIESYRTKHGFKELDIHNSPKRRNRDFKPMLYGDFIGMLNFKLSEPWALTRHLPDLVNESHQKPIQWIKYTIKGAVIGAIYGLYQHSNHLIENRFVDQKLYLSEKRSPFHIRGLLKYAKIFARPMGYTAGLFLGYKLLYDFFEHHTGGQDIPDMFHHFKAWVILSPFVLGYFLPFRHLPWGIILSATMVFPTYWYIRTISNGEFSRTHQICPEPLNFYQAGVSKAEKDKFEHQDRIEAIGWARATEYMYGKNNEGPSFISQKLGR